ncbi:MAG: hypothetical protein ABIB97_02245 [Patescibacteria group bacterium]
MSKEAAPALPNLEDMPSNPESAFAKGDVTEKLEILVGNRKIYQDIAAEYGGEEPPAQEEVEMINARMERELLEEIRKSREIFLSGLDAEGKTKTLELVKEYLEFAENADLKEELQKLEMELSKE